MDINNFINTFKHKYIIMEKKNKFFYLFLVAVSLFSGRSMYAQEVAGPVDITSKKAFDYNTSWIGNEGGTPTKHIPHTTEDLYVRSDGYSKVGMREEPMSWSLILQEKSYRYRKIQVREVTDVIVRVERLWMISMYICC